MKSTEVGAPAKSKIENREAIAKVVSQRLLLVLAFENTRNTEDENENEDEDEGELGVLQSALENRKSKIERQLQK